MNLVGFIRENLLLEGQEVPLWRAEAQLRRLRQALVWTAVPVVLFGGLLAYRWPAAKARGVRILVERLATTDTIALEAYRQGISEVEGQAVQAYHDPSLSEDQRMDKIRLKVAIRDQLMQRRKAAEVVLDRATRSQVALPARIYGWTPFSDPFTGQAYLASATRQEVGRASFTAAMISPEQAEFLHLVAKLSHPAAPALDQDTLKFIK